MPTVNRNTDPFEFEKKFRKSKKFEKEKTKGDVLRTQLKDAIKEMDFRQSKDRSKKLQGPKKDPKIMAIDKPLKKLKSDFRFSEKKPGPIGKLAPTGTRAPDRKPGEDKEMQPLAKGGRAGYKSGTRGCKLAMKGKGRAYGKNS